VIEPGVIPALQRQVRDDEDFDRLVRRVFDEIDRLLAAQPRPKVAHMKVGADYPWRAPA
jgi:hypothetical protein